MIIFGTVLIGNPPPVVVEMLKSIGGVFAPSIAGIVADAHGLAATLWILAGITAAIIVLALFLRETAPAVLARRRAA